MENHLSQNTVNLVLINIRNMRISFSKYPVGRIELTTSLKANPY